MQNRWVMIGNRKAFRHGRPGSRMRGTVETTPRLSARQTPPRATATTTSTVVLWRVADGVIRVRIERRGGHLEVQLEHPEGAKGVARFTIDVIERPCRFGGERRYFRCPRCEASTEHLYVARAALACRVCADLTYTSRRMRRRDRDLVAAGNLRVQIGGAHGVGAPFPPRPRGMHTRTYAGIVHAIHQREQRALSALSEKLRKMLA